MLSREVRIDEQTELSSVGRALDCRSKGRWFNSGSSDFFLFCNFEHGIDVAMGLRSRVI